MITLYPPPAHFFLLTGIVFSSPSLSSPPRLIEMRMEVAVVQQPPWQRLLEVLTISK